MEFDNFYNAASISRVLVRVGNTEGLYGTRAHQQNYYLGNFRQFDYKLVSTDIYLPEILFKA
jgi:hypothetical protein